MYHISFIHSSVDGHLTCFHILTVVNEHKSVYISLLSWLPFFWVNTGSYDSSIFNFFRTFHTGLHSTEKPLDKFNTFSLLKKNKHRRKLPQRNNGHIWKANIILTDEKLNAFLLRSRKGKEVYAHHFYIRLYWKL